MVIGEPRKNPFIGQRSTEMGKLGTKLEQYGKRLTKVNPNWLSWTKINSEGSRLTKIARKRLRWKIEKNTLSRFCEPFYWWEFSLIWLRSLVGFVCKVHQRLTRALFSVCAAANVRMSLFSLGNLSTGIALIAADFCDDDYDYVIMIMMLIIVMLITIVTSP